MNSHIRALALCTTLLMLGGCASTGPLLGDVRTFDEPGADVLADVAPATVGNPTGGSIFASANRLHLFEDNKARDVGDLLTVVLVESTSAKTAATTQVDKNSSIGMAAPVFAGNGFTIGGNPILQAQADGNRTFDGSGNSAQSNQLNGSVTVRVVRDLGNGNLQIAGSKRLRLNQGDEIVQIQGIVRTADIGTDNRISSDRVGDARIVYGGKGTLARSNAMGWLGRFFNSALMPY